MTLPAKLTPARFLFTLLRRRPWLALASGLLGALWLVPGALLPFVVGEAVDRGIAGGEWRTLIWLAAAVAAIGIAQAVFGGLLFHVAIGMWIDAATTTQRLVSEHISRLGASLRPQIDTGEVLAIPSSDLDEIGNVVEGAGRLVGALTAFLVVGVTLIDSSPLLGTVALIAVPLVVLGMGPLLAPLHRRQEAHRDRLSEINSIGSDIVSGLRILRGIGGERQFLRRFTDASRRARHAGVAVARSDSWLEAAHVLLPGLVTVVITWLGAHLAMSGSITVGELLAFYGAAAFLVIPVSTATESAEAVTAALVAGKKVCRLLRLRPLIAEPDSPVPLPAGALELHDTATGFTAVAGKLTVVDVGAGAEALAARLARFADPEDGHRVLVSGVPADRVALDALRRRVVYAHNQDLWFSGVLREQVAPDHASAVDVPTAITAADADDIVDGLPNGLDELIGERGREVSGGQRQRLSLARALALDADVLLLDEPTSAVDAHTEARITERVAALRRGKTTVVFAQSPLWTVVADETVRPNEEVPPCR
ncbi:ABC-type multidrug transport system fused ATPase/permease subunit [Herbihabitans rhizosphaerae]|uniref:ABC-type multidrug transport system fused ATPase/permease subunit n=1 Tax=Herbihabitans rhizosphaerae TaxID=1872711 RepID=A0A4Q7KXC3_9PSEU|nr:ABC transporter ATP-binding protein [Herbihabitans rhizosphaerae]RZS41374.1 ABC-type multidrug transport system fused ATPase/permease subunit [Herbihabitans rhizosphaerae]